MDVDDDDSSPSIHSLLDKLKLEIWADSNDAAVKRKLTINSPMNTGNNTRNRTHDVDKEIADLENLIKRLQVEINQMSINASKPLKDYLLNVDCNSSELNQEIMTYPVINNHPPDKSKQELDSVGRTFKLLWNNTISAATSDVPELNLIRELDEDVEDENSKYLAMKDSPNNLNIHILRDNIDAKKNDETANSSIRPPIENLGNKFSEIKAAVEIMSEIATNDETKQQIPNKNKQTIPSDTKLDSAVRLGILLHIFGDKDQDGQKTDNSKPLDKNPESKIMSNSSNDFTDADNSDTKRSSNNENLMIDNQPNDLSTTEIKSLDTSNQSNTEIESESNVLKHSTIKVPNKKSCDKKISEKNADLPKINTNESLENNKHRNSHLHTQDVSSDTIIKPCMADENVTSNSTSNSSTKNNNTSLHNLKKHNRPHSPCVEKSNTKRKKNAKQSKECLTKQDIKTLHKIHKNYDSKTDVPQRLSIINIYLDSQKPSSNIIIYNKPKSNTKLSKSLHDEEDSLNGLHNVLGKQRSNTSICNSAETDKIKSLCDDPVKISDIFSQEFKTPSDEASINSNNMKISESMKESYKNKCLNNASLRSTDTIPYINSNPKTLDNDLSKSPLSGVPESNKSELNEINIIKETKRVDIKNINTGLSLNLNKENKVKFPDNDLNISGQMAIEAPTNDMVPPKTNENVIIDSSTHVGPEPFEIIDNNKTQQSDTVLSKSIIDTDSTKEALVGNNINISATLDTSETPSESSEPLITSYLPIKANMNDLDEHFQDIPKQTSTDSLNLSIVLRETSNQTETDSNQTETDSNQTETNSNSKVTEDLENKITSTTDSIVTNENMYVLAENKSIENLSYDTEELTDYESIADDNDSRSYDGASNDPQIFIQRTDITVNNGDSFSDAFEDSQDVIREPSR